MSRLRPMQCTLHSFTATRAQHSWRNLFPWRPQCIPLRASTKPYSRNGKVGEKGERGNYREVFVSLVTGGQIGNGIVIGFAWAWSDSRRSDRNRFAAHIYDHDVFRRRHDDATVRDASRNMHRYHRRRRGSHFGGCLALPAR